MCARTGDRVKARADDDHVWCKRSRDGQEHSLERGHKVPVADPRAVPWDVDAGALGAAGADLPRMVVVVV
eukprot:342882-Chlamydomonas_euryale.AAC.1